MELDAVLRSKTDPRWVETALRDFDRVQIDHAHCEKKAAASAMSLVSAYPDRPVMVRRLVRLAREELGHFERIHRELVRRGLRLGKDPGDPYAQSLLALVRNAEPERLVDRLLASCLIEARSCERLALLASALREEAQRQMYASFATAEAGHLQLFRDLAVEQGEGLDVPARLGELAEREAQIISRLPIDPRIH